jgi:hypothetical protein
MSYFAECGDLFQRCGYIRLGQLDAAGAADHISSRPALRELGQVDIAGACVRQPYAPVLPLFCVKRARYPNQVNRIRAAAIRTGAGPRPALPVRTLHRCERLVNTIKHLVIARRGFQHHGRIRVDLVYII